MKNLKHINEYYYDNEGNLYDSVEDVIDAGADDKAFYIHQDIERVIPKLKKIRRELREINDDLEDTGPYDEDIEDAIDALDKIFKKWDNRPLIKLAAKKYNV